MTTILFACVILLAIVVVLSERESRNRFKIVCDRVRDLDSNVSRVKADVETAKGGNKILDKTMTLSWVEEVECKEFESYMFGPQTIVRAKAKYKNGDEELYLIISDASDVPGRIRVMATGEGR